jgi:hypothetical protein
MKKIIAAFDGLKYSESTASYALEMAKKYSGKIFGIFLEDFTYHSYSIADLGKEDFPEQRAVKLNTMDAETRESAIRHFTKQCEEQGLNYSIHRDKNIAIRDLVHETRFADMIVIQNNETLSHYSETAPSNFIADLLERTECPVMVVPPIFEKLEKIIFLYDGEPSSVFAIKQFSYLMPDQHGMPVELVSVKETAKNSKLPEAYYMKEWLKLYYDDVKYRIIIGDAHKEITTFLKEQTTNCLVVLGAYKRSSISRMIYHSMADIIIKSIDMPLFISHR